MIFPEHYHLNISHNEHLIMYMDLREYLLETNHKVYFENDAEFNDAIIKNELWIFQIYPKTSNSFIVICASSFERCIEIWKEKNKKDQKC